MNLLSPKTAAQRLDCSRAHIYALVAKKKLKPHYIGINGGSLRVSEEDIERYISESAGSSTDHVA